MRNALLVVAVAAILVPGIWSLAGDGAKTPRPVGLAGSDSIPGIEAVPLAKGQEEAVAAYRSESTRLAGALAEAVERAQGEWHESIRKSGARPDPKHARPGRLVTFTLEAVRRGAALTDYVPEALDAIARREENFVPKCSICGGARKGLSLAAAGVIPPESLLVPAPSLFAQAPDLPDLSEVSRTLDALLAHRRLLKAALAEEGAWRRLVAEQTKIGPFMERMRAWIAGTTRDLAEVDPQFAASVAKGAAAEKEKMDQLARHLFERDICYFCTAEAEGAKEGSD